MLINYQKVLWLKTINFLHELNSNGRNKSCKKLSNRKRFGSSTWERSEGLRMRRERDQKQTNTYRHKLKLYPTNLIQTCELFKIHNEIMVRACCCCCCYCAYILTRWNEKNKQLKLKKELFAFRKFNPLYLPPTSSSFNNLITTTPSASFCSLHVSLGCCIVVNLGLSSLLKNMRKLSDFYEFVFWIDHILSFFLL